MSDLMVLVSRQNLEHWERMCSDNPASVALMISHALSSEGSTEFFDAALAREAALREELAKANKDRETLLKLHVHLRARRSYWIAEETKVRRELTAAEQRNADQLAMLHMAKELLSTISLHKTMTPAEWCDSFKNEVADRLEKLHAFLAKPTESGASE